MTYKYLLNIFVSAGYIAFTHGGDKLLITSSRKLDLNKSSVDNIYELNNISPVFGSKIPLNEPRLNSFVGKIIFKNVNVVIDEIERFNRDVLAIDNFTYRIRNRSAIYVGRHHQEYYYDKEEYYPIIDRQTFIRTLREYADFNRATS